MSPPKTSLAHARAPTVHGASQPASRASFVEMWGGYPSSHPYVDPKTGEDPPGFRDQCAIKLSVAMHAGGIDMRTFKGASVRLHDGVAAVRAQELANWLKLQHVDGVKGAVDIAGADWQDKIKGRHGIVFFANYWKRDGEKTPSGDHIDLWNGNTLTGSGLEGALVSIARFQLGIQATPWFSDLGKSTQILFWEIR